MADDIRQAGTTLPQKVQIGSFPEDFTLPSTEKLVLATSRFIILPPEFNITDQPNRAEGRLCRCKPPEEETLHPVVLDPRHPTTQVIFKDFDSRLMHPSLERIFAQLRQHL